MSGGTVPVTALTRTLRTVGPTVPVTALRASAVTKRTRRFRSLPSPQDRRSRSGVWSLRRTLRLLVVVMTKRRST
eukprot:9552390-Heterocapsa_arctica.AAC.1